MRTRGRGLAGGLRAGGLVVLAGPLGAGKTTLTQGIGDGLGVRGPVTSPTFVIARVHPPLAGGPALVHVDAYRLGDAAEVDDLDLDTDLDRAVTVVEWGAGVGERLAEDRLGSTTGRPPRGARHDETRTARLPGPGARCGTRGLLPRGQVNRAGALGPSGSPRRRAGRGARPPTAPGVPGGGHPGSGLPSGWPSWARWSRWWRWCKVVARATRARSRAPWSPRSCPARSSECPPPPP